MISHTPTLTNRPAWIKNDPRVSFTWMRLRTCISPQNGESTSLRTFSHWKPQPGLTSFRHQPSSPWNCGWPVLEYPSHHCSQMHRQFAYIFMTWPVQLACFVATFYTLLSVLLACSLVCVRFCVVADLEIHIIHSIIICIFIGKFATHPQAATVWAC